MDIPNGKAVGGFAASGQIERQHWPQAGTPACGLALPARLDPRLLCEDATLAWIAGHFSLQLEIIANSVALFHKRAD